ncbi:hypothetical protein HDU93_003139, partial [Gonapodya sp. JEL0774]
MTLPVAGMDLQTINIDKQIGGRAPEADQSSSRRAIALAVVSLAIGMGVASLDG